MPDFFDGPPPDRKPTTANEKAAVALIALTFVIFIAIEIVTDFSPQKLSAPFFLISWVILLVIHEFGHALMARAVGWHVELISLGFGALRAQRTILGIPVEIRTIPISGFILPRPADLIAPRLKEFLVYAAGPGVELLAVAVIALVIGPGDLTTLTDSIPTIAVQSFCVAALAGAILNLIPISFQSEHGRSASDGLGMILCWARPDAHYAAQLKK